MKHFSEFTAITKQYMTISKRLRRNEERLANKILNLDKMEELPKPVTYQNQSQF
jgi:hypothetical protein